MNARGNERPPGDGFEIALIAAGAIVIASGFTTWAGARLAVLLAGHGRIEGGLDTWLPVTARLLRGQSPDDAWGTAARDLPAGVTYWIATVIAALVVTSALAGLWWVWRRIYGDGSGSGSRRRFGQHTDAREATRRDVTPLVVDTIVPPEGRMLLGRMAGTRTLLATEDRNRHPLQRRAARRQGNRGSVALIGPTGSGKTALAASAIATWNGPVVAVSVKRDLYDTTARARAVKGDIAMFDPGGATGMPTARWSPLEAVTTSTGALRTGRALAQAIPKGGVSNADYWAKHGEKLLGAFMSVAGLARLVDTAGGAKGHPVSMEQVASWVTTMAAATDPTINHLLRRGLQADMSLEAKLMARYASTTFTGIAKEDHKIRSSIYSTAALALDPWLEPSVAHSATASDRPFYWSDDHLGHKPRHVTLDWLVNTEPGRANTLYLAASQPEFERLSPVLGGLLADLKDTIHAWDIAGRRLERPLLFVIDEAGQLELGWLPAEVSTIAALGAFFVTCWQSLSQMQHRYTTLADAVLSGHRTKCFFAGVDDLATTRYLSNLLGSEHVTRRSWSHDIPSALGNRNGGRRSVSVSQQREEFAPANALRQMYPGEAVLLHGTLPPIHLDAVRWWKEPHLANLVPLTSGGDPAPPDGLATCPLSDQPAVDEAGPVDQATLDSALAQLPEPARAGKMAPARAGSASASHGEVDGQLPLFEGGVATMVDDPPPKRPITPAPTVERYSGRCELCHEALRPGEGQQDKRGGRLIIRCAPSCTERKRQARAHQS